MKLQIVNPLIKVRKYAENRINMIHQGLNTHQEVEHMHKRIEAMLVTAGGTPSAEFAEEAQLMQMTVQEFAALIQSKPNETVQRGLKRRKAILAIRATSKPEEIEAIVEAHRLEIHKEA